MVNKSFDVLNMLQQEAVFVVSVDDENKILFANKKAIDILKKYGNDINKTYGYDIDSVNLVGLSIHAFHKDPDNVKKLLKALKPGEVIKNADIIVGNMRIESYRSAIFDENNNPIYYVAIWKDVSLNMEVNELKEANFKIQRLSKFNRLLGEINQHINLIEDEKELLQKICDITIRFTDAKLAWIGKPDETGKFIALASSGEVGYLDDVFISIDPNIPEGRGPTSKTWRDKKPYFFNSFLENEHTKPWKERAKRFGISMSATLPVFKNKEIYAVFSFYLPEGESFDDELIKIIEEIGKNISYGLDRLELLRKERELNDLNKALLNNSTSGIMIGRYLDRVMEYANKQFVQMLGYDSEEELIGKSGREIYPSDKEFLEVYDLFIKDVLENGHGKAINIALKKKDGSIIHMDLSGVKLSNNPIKVVWTFVDVEDRYQLEKELERQAIKDALTGLNNRRALEKELERAFKRARRSKKLLAVCMLDLDGFKPVNDTHGHDAGDEVLKAIANRLVSVVRNIDFVARLGGDEFVVLLEDLNTRDEIYPILERIEYVIKTPIGLLNGNIVSVGTSIGIVIYNPKSDNISNEEELIRMADKALYESKAHKKDRLSSYTIYGEKIKTKASKN